MSESFRGNIAIIGSTADVVLAMFGPPQHDEHVQSFRWERFAGTRSRKTQLHYLAHYGATALIRARALDELWPLMPGEGEPHVPRAA